MQGKPVPKGTGRNEMTSPPTTFVRGLADHRWQKQQHTWASRAKSKVWWLPQDLILLILEYLPDVDFSRCRGLNRAFLSCWNEALCLDGLPPYHSVCPTRKLSLKDVPTSVRSDSVAHLHSYFSPRPSFTFDSVHLGYDFYHVTSLRLPFSMAHTLFGYFAASTSTNASTSGGSPTIPMPYLRSLEVANFSFDPQSIDQLGRLTTLESLSLTVTFVGSAVCYDHEHRFLHEGKWFPTPYARLRNLTRLTTLRITEGRMLDGPCVSDFLGKLTNLTSLDLTRSFHDVAKSMPDVVSLLKKLDTLKLDDNYFQDVSTLASIGPSLTHLSLSMNYLTVGVIMVVHALTNLRSLDLSWNDLVGCDSRDPTWASRIQLPRFWRVWAWALPSTLAELDLRGTGVPSNVLAKLTCLQELERKKQAW